MEDFFKQQAGWLNTWQEQQQKLARQYAKWGEDLTRGVTGAARQQVPINFEDLLKTQQGLLEQFTSFGIELQRNIQEVWGDKLPAELLKQFNFNILQEFYRNWLASMKFPGGLQNPFMSGQNWVDPSRFLNSFLKQENPFFSVFSSRSLIDELQPLFNMLQGSKLPGDNLYSQLFTTWQGFFNQLSNTSSNQGFDKLLNAFVSWKERANQFLSAPQVGIHRETAQDYAKAISYSLDYIKAFAAMGKLMEETARKAGNRFQAKLVERSLNDDPPLKFSEFCNLWTKENEAVFLEVFGSKTFAKTQNEFTSAGLLLKIQVNKLVEKVLDQTPVALKRDADLMIKDVSQLKRELRQSRKEQKELVAAARSAQEAAKDNDQRIRALAERLSKVDALAEHAENAVKEIVELKDALQHSQKEQQRLAAEAKSAQEAIKTSEQHCETLTIDVKKAQKAVAEGERRYTELAAELSQVRSKLAAQASKKDAAPVISETTAPKSPTPKRKVATEAPKAKTTESASSTKTAKSASRARKPAASATE